VEAVEGRGGTGASVCNTELRHGVQQEGDGGLFGHNYVGGILPATGRPSAFNSFGCEEGAVGFSGAEVGGFEAIQVLGAGNGYHRSEGFWNAADAGTQATWDTCCELYSQQRER